MNIHHCLFKKNEDVPDEKLRFVASHILAIKQCESHIKYNYPQLKSIEVEDTGKAARIWLTESSPTSTRCSAGKMRASCSVYA